VNGSKGPVMITAPTPRIGSPGFNNPAVASYDPTGLRSSMTATWAALDKALESEKPDHLPAPDWYNDRDEIARECERKGIPLVIGKRRMNAPDSYNKLKW